MNSFWDTFCEGFAHILDIQGVDHILFLVALAAFYEAKHWKRLLVLVTAFTIGHAVTLIVAGLDLVRFRSDLIEFLIPVTILITAISNLFRKGEKRAVVSYAVTLAFGLIHGLGFSNYFRMIGNEADLALDLLAFNLGVEAGQIPVVLGVVLASLVAAQVFHVSHKEWKRFLSAMAFGASLLMIQENWIF
ncbi:MAG: hypothetical protein ACI84C_000406 [Flavobacteriales bacterium]|jgi:hypothetical protein